MNRIFAVFLLLIFAFQGTLACSIELQPLRKQFRKAKSVFAGRVESIESYTPSEQERDKLLPDDVNWYYKGPFAKVRFTLLKTWKNSAVGEREFIAITSDSCQCRQTHFVSGQEYVVFANERSFLHICEATELNSEFGRAEVHWLNRFWTRTWATIYPF